MEGRRSKPHKHWWFRPPAHSSPTWRFTAKCISLVHVSAFVAKLQRAHDDRTLDWVNDRNVSAATRAAVIAYVAKPGTITITRSVVDEPSTNAASRYTCKVEVKRVESHSPGVLRSYYEPR